MSVVSEEKDGRPVKQRRLHGVPLFDQTSPVEDDEDSSSSSSSSSINLPTTRLSHRLRKNTNLPTTESSSSEGESGEEDEEETTSSSDSDDSEDSESEEVSEEEGGEGEEEETEEIEDQLAANGPEIPRFTTLPAPASDLKARLQSFLPQLHQANVELENSREAVDKRIDHVSDDDEHYIEMEVGLGVLSERNEDATQIRLPHSPSSEEDDTDDGKIKDGQDGFEHGLLARLVGKTETKGTKRKIEELG